MNLHSTSLKRNRTMPILDQMTFRPPRRLLAFTLAAALLPLLALPAAGHAAKLRAVSGLRAVEARTDAITLSWKDRSRGESSYVIQARVAGSGGWRSAKAKRNWTTLELRRLEKGTLYEARVRACKRKRCAPWGRSVRAATLLAPINGPHPDPNCETFPSSDEFNRDISAAPLDPRSDQIVAQINADGADLLHPDFGSNPQYGIPYVVVPAAQPQVPIGFEAYGDESDPGPYPVPPNAPVEGGSSADGDRHVLVVRRPASPGGPCGLFELYRAFPRPDGGWSADSGAAYDLGAPLAGQRPAGWTSADAAGLPIYPGLVTYEEVRSGEIDHAIRITFEETRKGYLPPATHYASSSCDTNRPPMGLRLRLRAGYDISGISGDARVIATALKRYGVIAADNGSNWFISGSTDRRWDDENLNALKQIPGSAFEVVRSAAETTPC